MTQAPQNPLLDMLEQARLPDFGAIKPEHALPAVERLIDESRQAMDRSITGGATPSWETVIDPLDTAEDRLGRGFAPVAHLHAVMDSPDWRDAFSACLPKLSEFASELGQNTALFDTVQALRDSQAFGRLDAAQQRVVDDMLRDFRLAGVALDDKAKARYKEIAQRQSELATTYQQHVLDATQAWRKQVTDGSRLTGLPDSALSLLAQNARDRELDGWLITLDAPSSSAVLAYADDRELRAEVYEALSTRASDVGPNAGDFDNSALIEEILALRHESAQLLGFDNYAELSLYTKMADSPTQIERFLLEMAERTRERARAELEQLQSFAAEEGIDTLNAWDLSYYSVKLKQQHYDFSAEDLRPYFPLASVVEGLFRVVERLYGVHITARDDVSTWHEDVSVYTIRSDAGEYLSIFYLDPYAREGKHGGAWMSGFQSRRKHAEGIQLPVAFLTCNFSPPVGDDPALLTHGDVITLFHEFGHGLHHMLTRVDYAPLAGITGVEWDAVELPSQFMENWCWERESLALFARHYRTGDPLPDELFDKLVASRHYMAAGQILQQVELSLFDLRLHRDYAPDQGVDVLAKLDAVRDEVAVMKPPPWSRLPHTFEHVFAGGYAAGYYSYTWAEVLSADAFAAFEETSLFDPQTGKRFLAEILARGSTRDAMDNFVAFRGREPSIDALLRHSGLT